MSGRGFSIARLMAVVLIVGLDCGLVRLFLATQDGLGGLLAVGLGVSAGLLGAMLARGVARRFWVGVMFGFLLFVVVVVGALAAFPADGNAMFLYYVNGALRRSPAWVHQAMRPPATPDATRQVPLAATAFVEVVMAAPALLTALVCGLIAVAVRRRVRPGSPAGPALESGPTE